MLKIDTVENFLKKIIAVENIICFGAGKQANNLDDIYEGTAALNKIVCFIDNDKKKQNTKRKLGNRFIDVMSFDHLINMNLSKTIILITCEKYMDILEQIEAEEKTKNLECYCLIHQIAFLKEDIVMKKRIPVSLKRSKNRLIPKTIHYCWFGKNPIPDQNKRWMESWHKFCPDYKIIEWNENNYDVSQNKYMKQAYEQKKWGFVPDFARLDIIYHYGGIYFDTDVELIKNIDDLLWQKGFACFENENYVNLGLGFGAVKNLPIIKEMLECYNEINFINEDKSLNLIASPTWQTRVLKERGLVLNGEYQIIEDLTLLPEKVLTGKNWYTKRIRNTFYTKAIHHYAGSWLDDAEKKAFLQIEEDINFYSAKGKIDE